MSARRRFLSVGGGALILCSVAVAAWAYFVSAGAGSGNASITTLGSPAPVSATPSGTGALVSWQSVSAPSGNAADVSYTVARSTDASTWVAASGTCAGTLAGSATTSCTDSPSSSGDYYYRVIAKFRTWTSPAQTAGTVHVTVCVTGTKLVLTSSPQTLAAGSVSGVITVQRQDASNAAGTCGTTTVDLSTSSGAGSFRDAGNTQTITSVSIPAGSSSASFRYSDTVVGAPTITAADHAAVLTQASQGETVTAATAAVVRVETAANGSGTVVPAQSLAAGSSITVYSVTRDTYGNFVANVAADAWSLPTKTGGVANGDLVPAGDSKSATFTGHLVGTATIRATSGSLATTDSGTITVTVGAATQIRVETAADGSGTVVPAQNVTAASAITVYSISRDGQGNFIANVATDASGWSLVNKTAGVVSGDLVAAGDLKSAVFTGHLVGTAKIHAVKTGLTSTDSGTITVVAGSASTVTIVSGSPQSAGVGTAFANALVVKVTDAGGNPISGASVTFSGPSSGASVTFASCSSNPQTFSCVASTNSSGQASSSTLTANATAGTFNVSASASGTNTVNFSLTNTANVSAARIGTATDTSASSSTSIPSVTTVNGKTELILVYRQSSVGAETISSITGPFSGTPTQIAISTGYAGQQKTMVYAWQAVGNGTTGTVTVNFSANQKNVVTVIDVIQLSNNNTSTPIAQFAAATGSSATATGALTSPAAGDAEIFFVGAGANTTVATPGGFTSLDFNQGPSGQGFGVLSAFNSVAQSSTSSTLGASNPWGSIVLEIKHS